MGWFCCVSGCSKRSECGKDISFHCLPHNNKKLLKLWIHKIGRKDLCVSASTRICSRHFVSSKDQKLQPNEYPILNLPTLPTEVTKARKRKSPRKRIFSLPIEEIVSHNQTAFFFCMGVGKRVWYINDTIVQTSTQSRVGDDWYQQQLLKRVNFLSS